MNQEPVFVTGMGLVTALGSSVQECWDRLCKGETGIQLRQPFAELPVLPLAMVGKHPARVEELLLPAVAEALRDAALEPSVLANCGVVIGSSRSFQGQIEAMAVPWLTAGNTPTGQAWLDSLPHMAAITVARQIGTTGPVSAPMAACATGLWAMFQGAEFIRSGVCDRVIVGAVEAPITPLTLAGFLRMGALAKTGCYPFSPEREGLVLGEGCAVLVLESSRALAQKFSTCPVYGRILGAGLTADAYHLTAPDPHHRGSRIALQQCLERSQLHPESIGYIHTHGTSTTLNDCQEVALITETLAHLPAMSSTKGATGHTLGASGAIGAALTLLALKHQTLPPNVGLLGEPVYPNLVKQPETVTALDYALCFSFGFGGQNAVLCLAREP